VVSYFIGNDPDRWYPDVPVWGGVRYVDLYPGVDLELSSRDGRWTWRAVARDEAALSQVRLRAEGTKGLTVDRGNLRLITTVGNLALPLIESSRYVRIPDTKPIIQYKLPETFEVFTPFTGPNQATSRITQPVDNPSHLLYSTLVGGGGEDHAYALAVDADGAIYITGLTFSSDFPTTPGAFDTNFNGEFDIFVTKLNPTNSAIIYSTFLGGRSYDRGNALVIDTSGDVYLTGSTESDDFPTTVGAFDTDPNGADDAFVIKLNAAGSRLIYSTLLGGSSYDSGQALILGDGGAVYVTGTTGSRDFPTFPTGVFDVSYNGGFDVFVTELDANGSWLVFSTFLGGSYDDLGQTLAIDSSGAVYVAGRTWS